MGLNKKYLFGLGAIAVIALGALALYTVSDQHQEPAGRIEMRAFLQKKEQADALHQARDLDGAIRMYEELAEEAPNAFYKGKMLAFLAFNLYRRGEPGDHEESMRVYKSIINDYTIPTPLRALTFGDIAALLLSKESFVRANLNQEPFASFFPRLGDPFNPTDFAMKINDYSDELYPNMAAKTNNAFLLATLINAGKIRKEDMEATRAQIMTYIQEADALEGEIQYEPGHLAEIYLERATALQVVGRTFGTPSAEEREQAFRKALEVAGRSDDPRSLVALAKIRLIYSGFLLRFTGKDRTPEMQEQLSAIITGPEGRMSVFHAYLRGFAERKEGYVYDMVKTLQERFPEFRTYLSALGIVY